MNKKTLYGVDKSGGVKQWSIHTEGGTVVVQHGKCQGKMQEKKTVCKPKNLNKANETNSEQQAILEAQSKWNKQYDKYYRETVEEARALLTEGVMLAQDYSKKPHFLDEEFYVSAKLDGLRTKTLYNKGVPEWHSRGGKTYPVPEHLVWQLKALQERTGISSYDGESYIHQVKLQRIQSCVKKPNELTPKVQYMIFDVPMLGKDWLQRKEILDDIEKQIVDLPDVHVVLQELCTKQDLESMLHKYLELGYEGLMLRNFGGEYLFQNKRSNDLLKYKVMFDSECKVLSCVSDKNNQGKFTVEWTNPDTRIKVQFDLSMNGSQDENHYDNLSQRIGEWVTFKYQGLTEDGVPTFARGLCFRDCNEEGVPNE